MWNSKPFFQRMFRPLAARLARVGVRANHVSLTTLGVCIAGGLAVAARPHGAWFLIVPGALAVRLVLNHVDGLIAHEHDSRSAAGTLINDLLDAVCDTALYLPLAAVAGASAPLAMLAVVAAVLSEMTGLAATRLGRDRREDGPLGKKPRGVAFGAIYLALGLGAAPGPWLDVALAATVALIALTIANRARAALRPC